MGVAQWLPLGCGLLRAGRPECAMFEFFFHVEPFQLWGTRHLLILGSFTALTTVLCLLVRFNSSPALILTIAWSLASCLLLSKLITLLGSLRMGTATLHNALPLHLCDWAAFAVILGLVRRKRLWIDLAYFWGVAGTLQALLTPDLGVPTYDFRFATFFITHGLIVTGALFLVLGCGLYPDRHSMWRAYLGVQVYFWVAAVSNSLLNLLVHGTWRPAQRPFFNYGFLCASTVNPSLLDWLGPWPWYLLSLQILALVLFFILASPFLRHSKESAH